MMPQDPSFLEAIAEKKIGSDGAHRSDRRKTGGAALSGVKPRVQGKWFLLDICDEAGRAGRIENDIPAVRRDHAWDEDVAMLSQQAVAEGLLAGARDAGVQPIRIGDHAGINFIDM